MKTKSVMATPGNDELKKQLYNLIDGIENERLLIALREFFIPYVIQLWAEKPDSDLEDEQFQQFEGLITGAGRREIIVYEEFKINMDEWLAWLAASNSNN